MQVEVAKELINNTDATTIGVLLAFIVILIFAIYVQWKKANKDEEYIRQQDKANLEMLSSLVKNAELLGNDVSDIKNYTTEMKPTINQIAEIVKTRLEKY